MSPVEIDVPPGLEGVIAAETEVGDVRGDEGYYHYRQYDAVDLAATRPLEDVWHLLFDGHLPAPAEREVFLDEVRQARVVPPAVATLLPAISRSGGPLMDQLRTAVSLVGHAGAFRASLDLTPAERRADALRLAAVVPTLVMALYRLSEGLEPVAPHPELGYGANYLWMSTGEEPDPGIARSLAQYQIITIDHGFNPSTFASRVVISTGADVAAAVVAGIGALSGPLHGGAPARVLDLLDAVGTGENARPYLVDVVGRGGKIMGFGHRIYRGADPRAVFMRQVAERVGAARVDLARQVERAVVDVLAELKPGRNLQTNVEFYAGVVMDHAGLPRQLFAPTFATSRVIGWCANLLEQAADNRIFRPSARYVGPPPPEPVPRL